jgi:hypothetical protein
VPTVATYLRATIIVNMSGSAGPDPTLEVTPIDSADTGFDDAYADYYSPFSSPGLNNSNVNMTQRSFAGAFSESSWVVNNADDVVTNLATIVGTTSHYVIIGVGGDFVTTNLYDIHLDIYQADHAPASVDDYWANVTKYYPSVAHDILITGSITTPADNTTLFQNLNNAVDGDDTTFATIGFDDSILTTPSGVTFNLRLTLTDWAPLA